MLAPHRRGRFARTLSADTTSAVDENQADESPHIVLPSSTELFYFYRQSLEQCAKYSTGQALFDLCTLHKKWLKIYAGAFYQSLFFMLLNDHCRGSFILKFEAVSNYLSVFLLLTRQFRPPSAPRKSTDSRFDPQELKHSCIVINTADYCQTTAVDVSDDLLSCNVRL